MRLPPWGACLLRQERLELSCLWATASEAVASAIPPLARVRCTIVETAGFEPAHPQGLRTALPVGAGNLVRKHWRAPGGWPGPLDRSGMSHVSGALRALAESAAAFRLAIGQDGWACLIAGSIVGWATRLERVSFRFTAGGSAS